MLFSLASKEGQIFFKLAFLKHLKLTLRSMVHK